MKILVLNGPNLNLLGKREPEIYGHETYEDLKDMMNKAAEAMGISLDFCQSNHEGALVDMIQDAAGKYDGIVMNPAAYTHTSIAIPDAVKAVGLPVVEVHISDPDAREKFRKISYIRETAIATVKGEGLIGYAKALEILKEHLK